ncbi:MAG: SusD/RagB family nutrient-binding outer membrane lipoprotein, partial [Flavobacteriaceae bacterium]|nr:SusD/RagB family nutrient-binding outer membrane lipoprotein [Flavobacteriaceae bacterium]
RNALKQYAALRSYSGDENVNYRAIGKIMESFHFQILVDIYGDIPYSEALLRGGNPTPKYDDAQEVYTGIIATLDEAIMMIDGAGDDALVPGSDDITFGGDMDMWKVFANTIKLRVLVRQGGGDFSGMAAIGFMSDDVMVQPGYSQDDNKQSPIWDNYGFDTAGGIINNNDATCATDYILQYLQDRNDPRIDYIYEEPATGHLGVFQGLLDYDNPVVDQFEPSKVSNLGPGILVSPSQPAAIFLAADSYFLQAEAIQRGYLTGDAQTAYENGIQASFDYLGAGDASAYYGQPTANVSWAASPDKIEAIITQKWLATNSLDAIQSWFDYSRTGFPSDLPISALASTPDRPVRLFYPASEVTSNNANVPNQSNAFTDKIFWAN